MLNKRSNNPKFRATQTFYIKMDDLPEWQKFLDLIQIENMNKNELINKAWKEYARHHHPGNPQVPLTKFPFKKVTKGTQKQNTCFLLTCKRKAAATARNRDTGKEYPVCRVHAEELMRHEKWSVH